MQPFRLCNDESFLNLLYALDPKFVPPDRKTLSDYLRDDFDRRCQEIKVILNDLKSKVSLTTDCWLSAAGDPYIVITCHFIDEDFFFQSFILDFVHFPHPHDAFNIAEVIKEVIYEFNISKKIQSICSNSAKNFVSAVDILLKSDDDLKDVIHMRCSCHVCNLSANLTN